MIYINDKENDRLVITIVSSKSIKDFKECIFRGVNTWEKLPLEVAELYDDIKEINV